LNPSVLVSYPFPYLEREGGSGRVLTRPESLVFSYVKVGKEGDLGRVLTRPESLVFSLDAGCRGGRRKEGDEMVRSVVVHQKIKISELKNQK
jgi:hypothetical protein